jgi:hypothetical protein
LSKHPLWNAQDASKAIEKAGWLTSAKGRRGKENVVRKPGRRGGSGAKLSYSRTLELVSPIFKKVKARLK